MHPKHPPLTPKPLFMHPSSHTLLTRKWFSKSPQHHPKHSQLPSVWPHLPTKSIPTVTCSTCKLCSINPPPNLPLTNPIPHETTFQQPLSLSHILPTTKHYPTTALQTTLQHSLHLQTILHSSKIHLQSTLQQSLTILPNNH